MSDFTFDTTDVDRVLNRIAREHVKAVIKDAAPTIHEIMKAYGVDAVPVDTGELRKRFMTSEYIGYEGDFATVGLSVNLPYAMYQEFGTKTRGLNEQKYPVPEGVGFTDAPGGIRPHNFLRRALYKSEKKAIREFARASRERGKNDHQYI